MPFKSICTLSLFLLLFAASSCKLKAKIESIDPGEVAEGTVFLWVSSDKDAYVSCGSAGTPCSESQLNFGKFGQLVVAKNGVALKKSYVHFGLPILPEGTVIEEAWFEMYHPGKNEDGKTDDILIPFATAAASWSPMLLNLDNEPNPQLTGGGGGVMTIHLNSQAWSGSGNISGLIKKWYDGTMSNYGFYIYWNLQNPGIEKGFYSNNDIRRKAMDLGLAPRLLIKIKLPDGKSTNDISLPPIPAGNDLDFNGQEILMMRFSGGDDWPEVWKVTRGN